jgi:hypothetical protein
MKTKRLYDKTGLYYINTLVDSLYVHFDKVDTNSTL